MMPYRLESCSIMVFRSTPESQQQQISHDGFGKESTTRTLYLHRLIMVSACVVSQGAKETETKGYGNKRERERLREQERTRRCNQQYSFNLRP